MIMYTYSIMCEEKMEMSEKEEIDAIMRMERDSEWLESVYNEIREKFVDKFIAVKNRQIIGNNSNLQDLLRDLRSNNEDPNSTLIQFIPSQDFMLIL